MIPSLATIALAIASDPSRVEALDREGRHPDWQRWSDSRDELGLTLEITDERPVTRPPFDGLQERH